MKAIKSRIIEIQIEDEENILLDHYSSLFALASKIKNAKEVNSIHIIMV